MTDKKTKQTPAASTEEKPTKEARGPHASTVPAAIAEPATEGVGTNSLALPWPKDPQGYLKTVKAAVTSAKRIKGDKERMKDFLKALKVLEAYAKEVYVKDVEARKDARTNAVSAKARINEKLRRQAEAKAKEYEVAAARVRAEAGIKVETAKEG